jgi:hypothetical protein
MNVTGTGARRRTRNCHNVAAIPPPTALVANILDLAGKFAENLPII